MAEASDFLNSRSMLTPGIAGGITLTISSALWIHFEIPQKWSALVISFILSLLVFRDKNVPLFERGIYYIVNAMIIFSVGVGAHTISSS